MQVTTAFPVVHRGSLYKKLWDEAQRLTTLVYYQLGDVKCSDVKGPNGSIGTPRRSPAHGAMACQIYSKLPGYILKKQKRNGVVFEALGYSEVLNLDLV